MRFGEFEIDLVSDGAFGLDGGAMFGVVPKVLWERTDPADEKNRITLSLNCLLIRTADEIILVDTGIGNRHDEKFATIFAINQSPGLLKTLAQKGIQPADVTKVIQTHLHFDHCGGNCRKTTTGEVVPTFPNATYYINGGELDYANAPDPRSRASYLKQNWEPLTQRGMIERTVHGQVIMLGVTLLAAPGHTENHQLVKIESGGRIACFMADLVPTASHLKTAYVMGYDLSAQTTMQTKDKILPQAARENWLLLFQHCPTVKAATLSEIDGKRILTPVEM